MKDSISLRTINANGINIRIAEKGDTGPLVVLVHGWPELWYSWRHQIPVLASEGFRVIAPDLRGYGGTDKPMAVGDYDMLSMAADVIGVIEALGEEKAILIGHDWGASICYNTCLLHPTRIKAVAGLSVPYFPRSDVSPLTRWETIYKDKFFYQVYFQKEGIAEKELEADVPVSLRKIYFMVSGEANSEVFGAIASKTPDDNLLDGLPDPQPFPSWLTDEDLDYCVAAFEESGFRGSLNRYRCQHSDWESLPQLQNLKLQLPSCFIGGTRDLVRGFVPGMDLYQDPGRSCEDFRGSTLVEGVGHWVQQEAPEEVNRALLSFLGSL